MATCIHAFYNAPVFLLIVAVFVLQGNTYYISQEIVQFADSTDVLCPGFLDVTDEILSDLCLNFLLLLGVSEAKNLHTHKLSYMPERLLCPTLLHHCSVRVVTTTNLCGHGRLKGGYLSIRQTRHCATGHRLFHQRHLATSTTD